MEGEFKPAHMISRAERRREWIRYYSDKRLRSQWMQLKLLQGLAVESVLEIGPYYGMVTALLDNAAYEVTTMDMIAPSFERPARPHRIMDLTRPEPDKLAGFDCIICAETLEHIEYEQALAALAAFRAAGPAHVLISVPYQGWQIYFEGYLNAHKRARRFFFKSLRSLRRFAADPVGDPHGHKWEIGFKGYPLQRFERDLVSLGYRIRKRDFPYPGRSVFHLLDTGAGKRA